MRAAARKRGRRPRRPAARAHRAGMAVGTKQRVDAEVTSRRRAPARTRPGGCRIRSTCSARPARGSWGRAAVAEAAAGCADEDRRSPPGAPAPARPGRRPPNCGSSRPPSRRRLRCSGVDWGEIVLSHGGTLSRRRFAGGGEVSRDSRLTAAPVGGGRDVPHRTSCSPAGRNAASAWSGQQRRGRPSPVACSVAARRRTR